MVRAFSISLLMVVLSGCVAFRTDTGTGGTTTTTTITPAPDAATTTTTTPATTLRVVGPDGRPIVGAQVGRWGQTGPDGVLRFETSDGAALAVRAAGYEPRLLTNVGSGDVEVVLEPRTLTGVVAAPTGRPLVGVEVSSGDLVATTDAGGAFSFSGIDPGPITIEARGWEPVVADWLGDTRALRFMLEPGQIRALHVTGWAAGTGDKWRYLLDLAARTEINSLVVDLKDESGLVFYDSTVELAGTVGAVQGVYDIDEIVDATHFGELYLIGRIVTFQDPIAARAAPDLAVWDAASGSPYQKNGQYFLDPTDPAARRYALDLAVEACAAGFDEIQFDYVRYPDGYGSSARFDGGSADEIRPAVIRDFLAEASELLHPLGCAVAADIFGFITSTRGDGGIGQQLEMLAEVTDVLSPMLYPSHYSEGWFGFEVPNDHPGPVVANGLDDGLARLEGPVIMRPWIQDFYYNASQVRAEIEAAEARGLGWMLWNALSNFTEGALLPAE